MIGQNEHAVRIATAADSLDDDDQRDEARIVRRQAELAETAADVCGRNDGHPAAVDQRLIAEI